LSTVKAPSRATNATGASMHGSRGQSKMPRAGAPKAAFLNSPLEVEEAMEQCESWKHFYLYRMEKKKDRLERLANKAKAMYDKAKSQERRTKGLRLKAPSQRGLGRTRQPINMFTNVNKSGAHARARVPLEKSMTLVQSSSRVRADLRFRSEKSPIKRKGNAMEMGQPAPQSTKRRPKP